MIASLLPLSLSPLRPFCFMSTCLSLPSHHPLPPPVPSTSQLRQALLSSRHRAEVMHVIVQQGQEIKVRVTGRRSWED